MKKLVCVGLLLLTGPSWAAVLEPHPLIVEVRQLAVEATFTDDLSKRHELVRKALDTAQRIDTVIVREAALSYIAIALADFGNISGALNVLASIEDNGSRTAVLPAIALAQARAGNVAETLRTVRDIADGFRRDETLHSIAKALAKARLEAFSMLWATSRAFAKLCFAAAVSPASACVTAISLKTL